MDSYLFQGIVLPERAQISLSFSVGFTSITSERGGVARGSIILNQVAVTIETEHEWNIHTLKNVVADLVQDHLNFVGFVKGLAYDLQITRVINKSRGVDYVFGIEVPCLVERGKNIDLNSEVSKLHDKLTEHNGVLLSRCFNDLVSAMKHATDTGFYCYRAIESLRHHCAANHGLESTSKPTQWQKFREVASCSEATLLTIKAAADGPRHGEAMGISSDE